MAALTEALTDAAYRTEAVAIIRTLVDKIVLNLADVDGKETVAIDLQGEPAGILLLTSNAKMPFFWNGLSVASIKLLAGAGLGQAPTIRIAV